MLNVNLVWLGSGPWDEKGAPGLGPRLTSRNGQTYTQSLTEGLRVSTCAWFSEKFNKHIRRRRVIMVRGRKRKRQR